MKKSERVLWVKGDAWDFVSHYGYFPGPEWQMCYLKGPGVLLAHGELSEGFVDRAVTNDVELLGQIKKKAYERMPRAVLDDAAMLSRFDFDGAARLPSQTVRPLSIIIAGLAFDRDGMIKGEMRQHWTYEEIMALLLRHETDYGCVVGSLRDISTFLDGKLWAMSIMQQLKGLGHAAAIEPTAKDDFPPPQSFDR